MKLSYRKSIILFMLFFLLSLLGYLFYFKSIGFVSDDFSGVRHIAGPDGFRKALEPLVTFFQGRPLGNASWRLQHLAFLPFPISYFQLWCGALVAVQAVLAYWSLRQARLAPVACFAGASFIGLAPFYQSVYLPVHAANTELSTTAFLMGLLFAYKCRPVLSAIIIGGSLLFYEQMAPFIWLPFLMFTGLTMNGADKFKIRDVRSAALSRNNIAYFLTLIAMLVVVYVVRSKGVGLRETELSSFSLGEITARALEAANVGYNTSWRTLRYAHRFFLDVSAQGSVYAMAGVLLVSLAAIFVLNNDNETSRYANFVVVGGYAVLGIFLIWLSHTVFITPERFPPGIAVGRLTNTHSGARFGFGLFFASLVHFLAASRWVIVRRVGYAFVSAILIWVTLYSHNYGASAAEVSQKKLALAKAYAYACRQNPSMKNPIIILPSGFLETKTDPVVDWTTHLTPPVYFNIASNKYLYVVTKVHEKELLEQLSQNPSIYDLNGLTGAGYAYLFGKNKGNLRIRPSESIIVRMNPDFTMETVWRPQSTERTQERCLLSPRKRFRHIDFSSYGLHDL